MKKEALTITVKSEQVEVYQEVLTLIQDLMDKPHLELSIKERYMEEVGALIRAYHEERNV